MDGDNRPVILLNLLLPERQAGDQAYVEPVLDRHRPTLLSPLVMNPAGYVSKI
jgi:hypothetical protein